MKTLLAIALLALATTAHAGEVFYTFPGPTPEQVDPWLPVGTVNGTGLSLAFGSAYVRINDSDTKPGKDWFPEPWRTAVGSYANEPSANGAMSVDYESAGNTTTWEITCSAPVRYIEFWYTGNAMNCCQNCTGPGECAILPGSLPIIVQGRNAQYQWQPTVSTPPGETGIDEECWDTTLGGACDPYHTIGAGAGDPTGHFRVWRKFTHTWAQPVTVFNIQGGAFQFRWYIDDLKVATVVPSPPCPPPCQTEGRSRMARRDGRLYATPARPVSWGTIKGLYYR